MMAEYHEPTQDSIDHFLDSNSDKKWVVIEFARKLNKMKIWRRNGTGILLSSTLCYMGLNYVPLFIMKTEINIQGYPKNT